MARQALLDGLPAIRGKGMSGVMWLSYRKAPSDREGEAHEIRGIDGVKHDRVQLLDPVVLDVLTCEEIRNLGVVWYENPTREFRQAKEVPAEPATLPPAA
jgi:hypothetical protein